MTAWTERLGRVVHAIHGTRGLIVTLSALLVLTIIEPAIPEGAWRATLTFPVFVVALVALATLPREGIAVQVRLRQLVDHPEATRFLARHLVFPFLLVVLLAPQMFLAAYGIPSFSPLTGLVLPSLQRRVAAWFLFLLVLLPVLHLRRTRRYAPEVVPVRPRALAWNDPLHRRRDLLVVLVGLVAVLWLLILQPFWAPFSLLAWPPGLATFLAGVRGVAAVCFSLFVPVLLFVHLSAHGQGLRYLILHAEWRTHWRPFVLLWAHVLLGLGAAALHLYVLLWIVRYQTAVGF